MTKTNIVIGAGLTGAVIANLLATLKNEKVLVVDRRTNVGGNCYDYRDKSGVMVQRHGSQVFHTSDERVWNYLKHFTDFNQYMHENVVIVDGIEVTFPFNLQTLHELFPVSLANRLEEKLLAEFKYNQTVTVAELKIKKDEDLKFLANYIDENIVTPMNLKKWGPSAKNIKHAKPAILISNDSRAYRDKYQGIPLDGYTAMIERMLIHPNIQLRLGIDHKEISAKFDRVFYTGSIDEYFNYELGQLPYRSLVFKVEEHETDYYQSNAVIEYPTNYDFAKVHEYKHYLNDKTSKTIIAKEYITNFELGRTDRYFPIPTDDNIALYNKYLEKAKELKNVYFLGRLGDYKNYEIDEMVARAIEVIEKLGKN